MPVKSFEIDSNPPKVGGEQSGVKTARLQVVSRCERDLFRKRRNNGAGDWFFYKIKNRNEHNSFRHVFKLQNRYPLPVDLQNRKQPATHHGLPAAGLETGTKKDATLYFAVGLEPTQSYLPLNILNF